MVYNNEHFYNVIIVDNLEDIRKLEHQSLDNEISGNGLFSNIFKFSPIGLVLVDSDTHLYKANKYMFDCFNLDYDEVIGQRFGDVFGCSTVAESKFLCGEADGCRECKLRNGITSVLDNQGLLDGVDIGHDYQINGRTVTKWFTVSASPVEYGDSVFALVTFVDITQRVRMEDRLRELGITDELTQLFNRRHIMKLYSDSLLSSKYERVSIALIDIDNFKLINDNYGHLVGDQVLMLLGDILKEQLRFSDYVGRYGGEEFLIVFPDAKLEDAEHVIEHIQKKFKLQSLELIGKEITFSVGLTAANTSEVTTEEDCRLLLMLSDKLMYQAKALGKDQIQSSGYSSCNEK